MMLDAKRTFDELIERLAPDEARARRGPGQPHLPAALAARWPARRSSPRWPSSTSCTATGASTSLVLDTPPSRNALDFLDAPDRLTGFLEGRALQRVPRPDRPRGEASSAAGRASSSRVLKRLTGVDLLEDLERLLPRARRADRRLPRARRRRQGAAGRPGTTFLLVTSPEREPVEEAIFFHGKLLRGADARSAALDRQPRAPARRRPGERGRPARAGAALGDASAGRQGRAGLRRGARAGRARRRAIARLRRATGEKNPVIVPQLDGDVHDVDGLVAVHAHLFGS